MFFILAKNIFVGLKNQNTSNLLGKKPFTEAAAIHLGRKINPTSHEQQIKKKTNQIKNHQSIKINEFTLNQHKSTIVNIF